MVTFPSFDTAMSAGSTNDSSEYFPSRKQRAFRISIDDLYASRTSCLVRILSVLWPPYAFNAP